MATLDPTSPPRRHERGEVSWLTLVILAGIAGTVWLAIAWVPVYYSHYVAKQVVRDIMNQAIKEPDDNILVQQLCRKLESVETIEVEDADGNVERSPAIQVAPEDVTFERDKSASPPTLHIAFEYTRQVRYPFLKGEPKEWSGSVDLTRELQPPDWGPAR